MIDRILENDEVIEFLRSRQLVAQYKKVTQQIISGHLQGGAQLQKRNPKADDIWYFRINQKYRAFAYLDGKILKVFHVDDHQ